MNLSDIISSAKNILKSGVSFTLWFNNKAPLVHETEGWSDNKMKDVYKQIDNQKTDKPTNTGK